ncbi:hypothetical protein AAT19DRAFT_10301 [Rhodotorula toruloides]|uniref:Uncharacterized protein n=1 Tax=Rhodotorula toruloides TaxID=5286 RepID=A0A2T0A0E2_RHOTO|nr:hypothetical protein AAT19DRAFT_10301 [Rhodotorula toruloides]
MSPRDLSCEAGTCWKRSSSTLPPHASLFPPAQCRRMLRLPIVEPRGSNSTLQGRKRPSREGCRVCRTACRAKGDEVVGE